MIAGSYKVFAGGGGIEFQIKNRGVAGKKGVEVVAIVWDTAKGLDPIVPLVGQTTALQTWDRLSGQYCEMSQAITDEEGKVYGICYSTIPGELEIYLDLLGRGTSRESHLVSIFFDENNESSASGDYNSNKEREIETIKQDIENVQEELHEQKSILEDIKNILRQLLKSLKSLF